MRDFRIPKLSHHKASGKAVVRLAGADRYLGPWGSSSAQAEYDRLIAEWLASGRQTAAPGTAELTVAEVMASYLNFAAGYYVGPDGKCTTEPAAIRYALRPVRRLYGHTEAGRFGPLCLKAVRQAMLEMGWCRSHINQKVNVVRRMFKWAAENELIPGSVHHALTAVSPLRRGRSNAPESEPIRPVLDVLVTPVLHYVSPQVAAMIQLQRLTGMRPGEVVTMRGIDLDTTGRLWLYSPPQHKTSHLGHTRIIYLGPQAKQILQPFLRPDMSCYLFSAAEAEKRRREILQSLRKTPMNEGARPGTNKRHKPARVAGARYTVMTYFRAVRYACDKAFPLPESLQRRRVPRFDGKNGMRFETVAEWQARLGSQAWEERNSWLAAHRWHPHQLRHTAATDLRKNFGLEAAQVILGHKTLSVTQIYAEKNVDAAMRIMAEVG